MTDGFRRQAARAAFALGLTGAIIGLGAGSALAASAPTVTVSGSSPVTANTTLTATAKDSAPGPLGSSHTLTLTVTSPDGHTQSWSQTFSNTQSGTVTGQVNTTCPSWSANPCVQAANGTYSFDAKSGSMTASPANVTLAVPPSDVTGFTASASGSVATFAWNANTDNVPDFAGYSIDNGSSSVQIKPNSGACDASTCGVSVDYGSAARGQTYTFSIRALRERAPGSASTIPSTNADTATVTFPAPPTPTPTDSSSGGGTSDGTSTGSGTGSGGSGSTDGSGGSSSTGGGSASGGGSGSTSASGPVITGRHPNVDLNHFLPATSAGAAPNLPAVVTEIRPLPQGTYAPTLPYGDQSVTTAQGQTTPGSSTAISTEIEKVLNLGPLWKSLAGAALLLLITAHLRAWLARIDVTD